MLRQIAERKHPWTVSMWELFVLKSPDQWADTDLILNRISTDFAADAHLARQKLIENTTKNIGLRARF